MNLTELTQRLSEVLLQRGWMLATAESCTGGMISAGCTELAGSSQWFERGFVSYSNDAKHELLGVPTAVIDKHGAVSEEVAQAMVLGALITAKPKSRWPSPASQGPVAAAAPSPWAPCVLPGPCPVIPDRHWAQKPLGSKLKPVILKVTVPRSDKPRTHMRSSVC